jgi:hypothetical protein
MSAWVRVRLSPSPQPDECLVCWDIGYPAIVDTEGGGYVCEWCYHRMCSAHEREPEVPFMWQFCDVLVRTLKWRAKQVQQDGYVHRSVLSSKVPPPEMTPEIDIQVIRKEASW